MGNLGENQPFNRFERSPTLKLDSHEVQPEMEHMTVYYDFHSSMCVDIPWNLPQYCLLESPRQSFSVF